MANFTRMGIPEHYVGASTDTKPTGVPPGSKCYEHDTGDTYITYDGTNWVAYTSPADADITTHAALTTGVHGATGTIVATEDVDDTPVNGATTAPVSSNWAYDHAADASAHHTATTRLDSKLITSTRDMTAASGDVSYTGVGFQPTCIFAMAAISGEQTAAWGFCDESLDEATLVLYDYNTNIYPLADYLFVIQGEPSAKQQQAVVKSFDADGFTLTWTKVNVPSAETATLYFLCLR